MDMRRFNCLMLAGVALSDEARTLLLRTAHLMIHTGREELWIRSPVVEGVVSTQWQYVAIGTLGGSQFDADIACEGGKTKVSYFVPSDDFLGMNGRAMDELIASSAWVSCPRGTLPDFVWEESSLN